MYLGRKWWEKEVGVIPPNKSSNGTSLAVQWLRLHASNAEDSGSTPSRGTKILHTWRCVAKKKKLGQLDLAFTNVSYQINF